MNVNKNKMKAKELSTYQLILIKSILERMLENKDLFREGLCQWVRQVLLEYRFTVRLDLLMWYINYNRPHQLSSVDAFIHRNNPFFWTEGDIKPRIKWIEKHIQIINKEIINRKRPI